MTKRTSSLLLLLLPALMLSPPPVSAIADTGGPATIHGRTGDSPASESRRIPPETMSRRNGFTRAGRAPRTRTGPAEPMQRLVALYIVTILFIDKRPPAGRDIPIAEGSWFSAVMLN